LPQTHSCCPAGWFQPIMFNTDFEGFGHQHYLPHLRIVLASGFGSGVLL
jgi:hypothetical protein